MKMNKKVLSVVAASVLSLGLIGCGGGGGSSSSNGSGSTGISGKAVDGYLRNANVCLDMNNNGICDAGEPFTTTDVNGAFSLDVSKVKNDANYTNATILVYGGIDQDTGSNFTSVLEAPKNPTVNVTPITTQVVALIKQGIPKKEAEQKIKKILNIDSNISIDADPVALAKEKKNESLLKAALTLQKTIDVMTQKVAQDTGSKSDKVANKVYKVLAKAIEKMNVNDSNVSLNSVLTQVKNDTNATSTLSVSNNNLSNIIAATKAAHTKISNTFEKCKDLTAIQKSTIGVHDFIEKAVKEKDASAIDNLSINTNIDIKTQQVKNFLQFWGVNSIPNSSLDSLKTLNLNQKISGIIKDLQKLADEKKISPDIVNTVKQRVASYELQIKAHENGAAMNLNTFLDYLDFTPLPLTSDKFSNKMVITGHNYILAFKDDGRYDEINEDGKIDDTNYWEVKNNVLNLDNQIFIAFQSEIGSKVSAALYFEKGKRGSVTVEQGGWFTDKRAVLLNANENTTISDGADFLNLFDKGTDISTLDVSDKTWKLKNDLASQVSFKKDGTYKYTDVEGNEETGSWKVYNDKVLILTPQDRDEKYFVVVIGDEAVMVTINKDNHIESAEIDNFKSIPIENSTDDNQKTNVEQFLGYLNFTPITLSNKDLSGKAILTNDNALIAFNDDGTYDELANYKPLKGGNWKVTNNVLDLNDDDILIALKNKEGSNLSAVGYVYKEGWFDSNDNKAVLLNANKNTTISDGADFLNLFDKNTNISTLDVSGKTLKLKNKFSSKVSFKKDGTCTYTDIEGNEETDNWEVYNDKVLIVTTKTNKHFVVVIGDKAIIVTVNKNNNVIEGAEMDSFILK